MSEASAFWVTGPARGEIRPLHLLSPNAGDLLIDTQFTAISRGTETLVFSGAVPRSEYQRMRAPFQEGDFPAPVKYGYANVGTVVEGRAELVGKTVFSLYPHQTRFVIPERAVTIVPETVPAGRAILAANLETAVNAAWDGHLNPGDRVAVIGAGTVGCLVAWLAGQIPGTEVELIDVDPRKRAAAEAVGVAFAEPGRARSDADVVFHASGNPEGLATALRIAAFEASVIELSWYGSREVSLALGAQFHSQRLTLKSSQVGHVSAQQRARWDSARRMQLVFRLLEAPELDTLVSGESPFASLPSVMAEISSPDRYTICHRIVYS